MEVETRGGERPIPGVSVGGLEVAGGGEGPGRRVPEAAAEVGDQRQRRPQRRDLRHEGRVLRHAPQRVVQRARPPLDAARRLVDAQRGRRLGRGLRCRRRHGGRRDESCGPLRFANWDLARNAEGQTQKIMWNYQPVYPREQRDFGPLKKVSPNAFCFFEKKNQTFILKKSNFTHFNRQLY